MVTAAHRKLHKARWMLRYWLLDKYFEQARIVAFAGATTTTVLLAWSLWLTRHHALSGGQHAFVWWVQLIIMVVAAVVAYALAPKPEPAKPVEGKSPSVEDGKAILRIYGGAWIDDGGIAAPFGDIAPEPIRRKGGKK